MTIKQKDNIIVIAGKYKGKKGKVLQIFSKTKRVIIENINLKTKHLKPQEEGKKGIIKQIEAPIHISNIALIQE